MRSHLDRRSAYILVDSFERGNRLRLEIRNGDRTLAVEMATNEPIRYINFQCGEWIRTAVLDPIQEDKDNHSAA